MANEQRGEVTVTLGGKEYTLRPTFEAVASIENTLGVGLREILSRFTEEKYGMRDMLAILSAGIKAAGGKAPSNLGALIMNADKMPVVGACAAFVINAWRGDPPESAASAGEEKAA